MRILGIDIGGTNIKYALVTDGLSVLETGSMESEAKFGAERLLKNVCAVCDRHSFDALGVSTAGIVGKDGEIAYANENIPNYTGTPLKKLLEEKYGVPVYVVNDIAAGALAEADGQREYYYLALGTGVGGMYVRGNETFSGAGGQAGQIGYLPSKNGTSIVDKTVSTAGLERLGKDTAKRLFERAETGDQAAVAALSAWREEFVHLCAWIVGLYNPSEIVLGGGISEQKEKLLRFLEAGLDGLPVPYQNTFRLKTATAGNYAGALGAVKYVKESMKQ